MADAVADNASTLVAKRMCFNIGDYLLLTKKKCKMVLHFHYNVFLIILSQSLA
ncbi:hypothetical protein [Moraxella lacunata]|uniref:hypothetical protein n=1 Tax=Moraxella lacunata TaxID=477 RepID=UPI003EE15DE4